MDNKERFIEIFTSQIHRPGAAELLEWMESTDFFEAPASTHYHGSYPGGLVEHSLNVYYELIGAGRVPGVPTAETYAVVALLHDICKADIRVEDYGPKPKIGKQLVLDKGTKSQRTYTINLCQEESGVYRMTMERTRQ